MSRAFHARILAAAPLVLAGALICRHAGADPETGATVGTAPMTQPTAAPNPAAAPAAGAADSPGDAPREKPLQYALLYRLDARTGGGSSDRRALYLGGLEMEYVGSYGRKW